MRYLGEDRVACPHCDGYGVDPYTENGETCPRCDGIGSMPLDKYTVASPRPSWFKHTIWSPLLCDPDKVEAWRQQTDDQDQPT